MLKEKPFFGRGETTYAILDLATAQNVVIYCGAGATRDQTGLGWDDLITAVFTRDSPESQRDCSSISVDGLKSV